MKNKTFTKKSIHCTVCFSVVMLVICLFPLLFTKTPILVADFTETGQIGDTIGGIIGPFVAIIASFLTFIAFWVQYKANEQQREDIALERFENCLFHLIDIQGSITNSLHLIPKDGADCFRGRDIEGRYIFEYLYCGKVYENCDRHDLRTVIMEKGIQGYEQDKDILILNHYFAHLYRTLKYIDEYPNMDFDTKYKYVTFISSSLSQYELVLLFYHGLSSHSIDDYKLLIEKYAIMKNLNINLLAKEEDIALYSEKIKQDYQKKRKRL